MFLLQRGWHTAHHYALLWGKHEDTVTHWAKSGFLVESGFRVAQVGHSPSVQGRGSLQWWIFDPSEAQQGASAAA